ncbi:molybdopterin molybdotransferase MoeA [Streptomyces sp. NPDC056358]|uniref:molybdopterin molybdotransferase MoeA n=1 Tax=Streptomyces sp. NPDC056358 TaxID=3345794 RepID=UPI0035DC7E30
MGAGPSAGGGASAGVGPSARDRPASADRGSEPGDSSPAADPFTAVGASPAGGVSSEGDRFLAVGTSSAGGSSSVVGSPSGGGRSLSADQGPTPEELRAAEEERAVEQALALVGRRSPGEPWSTARSHSADQCHLAGRPRPADEPHRADSRSSEQPCSPDRSRAPGQSCFMNPPRPAKEGADAAAVLPPDQSADRPRGRERHSRATPWRTARALAARSGRDVPVSARRIPLDQAVGRVLAEPLVALTDLPSFDTSAMDGWVVTGPGPWTIREFDELGGSEGAGDRAEVRGKEGARDASAGSRPGQGLGILAGHGAPTALPDGDAVRIATGARIPADANAVIRSEHAHVDETKGLLHTKHQVLPGQDIRPRGQECRSGDQLLPAGTLVTPAVLGLAAAAGYDELLTVPRPRVEVLVLGDELLTSGLPHDGLIRDALGPMIGPWLSALGAEVSAPQRLGDDVNALRRAFTTSGADLVITTGGTASGPVDHVHPVLAEIGAELLVDGVAVRPGHPMLLARLRTKDSDAGPYLVGLPGNPLAAVSGLLTLAEPLLRGLTGRALETSHRVVVRDEVHGHPHDTRLVPVVHRAGRAGVGVGGFGSTGSGSGAEHVVPLHYNGPAMLRGVAAADGLAVVPPGGVRSGTEVEILDLPWASATPWTEGCFT